MSKRGLLCALLALPALGGAQQATGPIATPQLGRVFFVGSTLYPTIQSAVTAACISGGVVDLPYASNPSDTVTGATGCSGVLIQDRRGTFNYVYAYSGSAWVQAGIGGIPGGSDNGSVTTHTHAANYALIQDQALSVGTAGASGFMDFDTGDGCMGVFDADAGIQKYLGFCSNAFPPSNWTAFSLTPVGMHLSAANGTDGTQVVFGVSTYLNGTKEDPGGTGLGKNAFIVNNGNQVYTYYQMLDDGAGNATLKALGVTNNGTVGGTLIVTGNTTLNGATTTTKAIAATSGTFSSTLSGAGVSSTTSVSGKQHVTTVVTLSGASPAINLASGGYQTITLSANATPTVTGLAVGQRLTMEICQPSSGGPYTWAWPSAIHGGVTIGTAASTCTVQSFIGISSTTMLAESGGVTGLAP